MNGTAARLFRLGVSLAGLVTVGWVLTGLAAKPVHRGIPLPTDWSHRHLIFSRPGTTERAARVSEDLRYWQQMYRSEQRLALPARMVYGGGADIRTRLIVPRKGNKSSKPFHRDWAENLGTGASAGAGNYPAKFSFDSATANCGDAATPDFVVYSTGLTGSATQASIVAYDNLYSGCTGTVPSVYWAYNTSQIVAAVPGAIRTSPVLSRDGKQISFVQTDGTAATVVLLKWAASAIDTVGIPGTPLQVVPALYSACTAPCMTTFALTNQGGTPTDDTTSSVFYDYNGDVAWVGDSHGLLHQFHPFFNGEPAEIRDANWPLPVSTPPVQSPLSSPVYDRITKNVFATGVKDGFLYRVDATTAVVVASGQLDFAINLAGPIVDSARGFVYVFAAEDNSGACAVGSNCAAVYQLSANFAAVDFGTEAAVGVASPGPTPTPLFAGGFDNAYLNSVDGTGKMYVCGNVGANATLYQVPIKAGALSDGVAIAVLGTAGSTPTCSPVTDVSDPGATATDPATERAFVSVQSNANIGICTDGCIVSMIDTPWAPGKNYTLGQEVLVVPGSQSVRRVYIVVGPGTSGVSEPHWPNGVGSYITDPSPAGVTWLNQGNPAASIHPWLATHPYTAQTSILDSNGTVQVVETPGTSGAGAPSWSTTIGGPTVDGSVVWANAGKLPMIGMPSSGGTSAIIIDNTVAPGFPLGTSQVYFTTLSDQVCGTTGTGGCAVQASQPGLN